MCEREEQQSAGPDGRPSDELLLAAVERGALHDQGARSAVTVWTIFEHLCTPRRSAAARHVRARLAILRAAGWLERSRRHGVSTWELTDAGRRYLTRVRGAGRLPELPESPQHRAWRSARTAAAQELERFRLGLRTQLEDTALLLEADPPAHSDAWFARGEELRRACWRVGSAGHCLREWSEPEDSRADVDDQGEPGDARLDPTERARSRARRLGRRNIRLW
jgi:hypothetical protein